MSAIITAGGQAGMNPVSSANVIYECTRLDLSLSGTGASAQMLL